MMTEKQYQAHIWLSRMWDMDNEIKSFEERKTTIISSLSGIGKYDSDFIPAQTGENSTETKNIEYSLLCSEIEKKMRELSAENIKTLKVLQNIQDVKIRNMLYDRYINRMSWSKVGEKYHYENRHSYNYMHKCLDIVRPFCPDDEIRVLLRGEI